jgi:uncharacterized protein (TIGR03083 family)
MDAAELVMELRSAGAECLAAMIALPATALENPGYENGWTVRQIMAHVASMEFAYRRLPELARAASRETATNGERFSMDDYNARQVEKRRSASARALLEEFAHGRGTLIALADNLDPDLLAAPVRSAGGTTGSLAEVMDATAAGHVRQHALDFMRAAGGRETSERDIAAAAVSLIAEEARALLDGVSETGWRTPIEGDWSPANLCGHIAEMLPYWAEQATQALQSGQPLGRELDAPERLGGPASFAALSPAQGVAALDEAARTAANAIRALPLDAWRTALPHRNGSLMPIAQVIEGLCVAHGHEHLDQLTRLLRAAD